MESSLHISSSEKKFITFLSNLTLVYQLLVNFIVENNPGDLLTNITHLSKYMLDKMPPKCEENLYRKQYGNLKDCVL
jgi:hypothetical protein